MLIAQSMLKAAKRECSRVESYMDLQKLSSCRVSAQAVPGGEQGVARSGVGAAPWQERAGVRGCAHRFLNDEVLMHQNRMRAMLMEMLMKTLALMSSEITWRAIVLACARSVFTPARRTPNVSAMLKQHDTVRSAAASAAAVSLARSREGRRTTRRSDGADASWREKELINHHGYGDYWNLF